MITHEITKPKPLSVFQEVKRTALALVANRHSSPSNDVRYMGKIEYAQWIEEIKKEFKAGDLTTIAALNYLPGRCPVPVFKVTSIEEIHWSAPIGEVHNQPRCIQITSMAIPNTTISYEPRSLRKLNEEELKLVYLRDHETKDQAAKPTECRYDLARNCFILLDASGTIIKEYPGTSR